MAATHINSQQLGHFLKDLNKTTTKKKPAKNSNIEREALLGPHLSLWSYWTCWWGTVTFLRNVATGRLPTPQQMMPCLWATLTGLSSLKIKIIVKGKSVSYEMMIRVEISIFTGQLPAASLSLQRRSIIEIEFLNWVQSQVKISRISRLAHLVLPGWIQV